MPLTWIDGREVAKKWKENAAQRVQALAEKGVTPHLAVIVAGDNPASQVYVRNKENACLASVYFGRQTTPAGELHAGGAGKRGCRAQRGSRRTRDSGAASAAEGAG